MASVTVSADRIAQVTATVKKWVADFNKPIDSEEDFLSSFRPDVEWLDHAFQIRRVGHNAVLGLYKGFTFCNQPFRADIKAVIPTASGAVVEQLWIGRCANDLVRPNGQIAVKASGKDFRCHVCFVVDIDENGKINRIDEYYNKRWDDGIPEQDYVVLTGDSMKSKA